MFFELNTSDYGAAERVFVGLIVTDDTIASLSKSGELL